MVGRMAGRVTMDSHLMGFVVKESAKGDTELINGESISSEARWIGKAKREELTPRYLLNFLRSRRERSSFGSDPMASMKVVG